MRRVLHIIMSIVLLTISAQAQVLPNRHFCGTDEVMQQYIHDNPQMQLEMDELERQLSLSKPSNPNKASINYTIPVVVHIVHAYGVENIPDANVHNVIDILNRDFQKLNADTSQVIPAFQGIIGDMEIQFRLATKDPNGNCTNGIVRLYDPVFTNDGGSTNPTKPGTWPSDKYLNIYVVKDIASGAGAYAYFPGVPASIDGVVCRYNQFGNLPPSPSGNFSERTMPHEVGHWLALAHPWGFSNNPGLPSNCNEDDNVGDTPNTVGVSGQGCNVNQISCGSLDNIQNIMDYSNCAVMFTAGQVTRAIGALNSSVGNRSNLSTVSNLIATGTDDASYANIPICTPIADFTPVNSILTCQGAPVRFKERSYNGAKDSTWTYFWDLPGATPNTSTDAEPQVVYNTIGKHNVTLTVTNSAGSSQPITKVDFVEILPGSGTFNAPYVERANDPLWPNNADPTLVWKVERANGSFFQFQRSTNAFYSPPSSIFLNNFNFNGAAIHSLESPPMNLTALQPGAAFVNFQVAHSKKGAENETIFLYMSDDCGQSFSLVKFWLGNTFVSPNSPNTGAYIPADTSEWRFLSQDISNYAGKDGVIMRFEFQSSGGNNIYFDDIAVSDVSSPATGFEVSLGAEFNLYPNPNKGVFNLDFYWDGSEEIQATLVDLVGKSTDISLGSAKTGWNSMEVDLSQYQLKSGLYLLRMSSGKSVFTKQVIIE